jgi:hypothetical protein
VDTFAPTALPAEELPIVIEETPATRAARNYVLRWRQTVLSGFWAIITGNKETYREFKNEYKALFSDPTEEEMQRAIDAIPENMRWWDAEARATTQRESILDCQQCGEPFHNHLVKVCPNCKVVLHDHCFDSTKGGYESPGCECCHHRCTVV